MTDKPQDVNDGQDDPVPDDAAPSSVSPSVRRLLRQYDIDIKDVRGTGPNGKVRPGDVLAIVGNPQLTRHDEKGGGESAEPSAGLPAPAETAPQGEPEPTREPLGTTVFAADMARVLAHRKRSGRHDISIASYAARAACLAARKFAALRGPGGDVALRVRLTGADGESTTVLTPPTTGSLAAIHDALSQSAAPGQPAAPAALSLSHHGLPGNLVDIPPLLERHESAALSLGGLQRTIGIGASEKGEAPRIVLQCHLAMTYRPSAIPPSDAARFVAECVRLIENWPAQEPSCAPADSTTPS